MRNSVLNAWQIGVACYFLGAVLSTPAPAQEVGKVAEGTLRAAISTLASSLQSRHLNGAKEVEVQPFQCDRGINANAGVAIQKMLIEDFAKLKVQHKSGAKMVCRGEYLFLEDEKKVKILTTMVDSTGEQINFRPLEAKVSELEDLVTLTGATGQLPVNDPIARGKAVVANVLDTAVQLDISKLQASPAPESPFAVEIFRLNPATNAYEPVPLNNIDGQAFADLGPKDIYGIKLFNRSPGLAAVNLTVDGLNLFTISEIPAYQQLGKLIIPNGDTGFLLRGWHINDLKSALFQVDTLDKSLVAKTLGPDAPLKAIGTMGVITVSFFAAIPPGGTAPPDEPLIKSLGTSAGPVFDEVYKSLPVRIGQLRSSVTIRYVRPLPPGLAAGGL